MSWIDRGIPSIALYACYIAGPEHRIPSDGSTSNIGNMPAVKLYVDTFDQRVGTAFVEGSACLRKAGPVIAILDL